MTIQKIGQVRTFQTGEPVMQTYGVPLTVKEIGERDGVFKISSDAGEQFHVAVHGVSATESNLETALRNMYNKLVGSPSDALPTPVPVPV